MHRRQLLRSLAGGLLFPATVLTAHAQEPGDGTPVAMPRHHGLPRPVVLGDGIELIDYRVYPSPDIPRVIGEVVNRSDEMVDAPVVSVTFSDLGPEGLAYAPSFLPVMRPGESNLIFGILPEEINSNETLASAAFGLCAPVGPGEHTERLRDAEFDITIDTEGYWAGSLNIGGTVHNAGTETVVSCAVNGLVRDHNGRYVGVAVESLIGDLAPGTTTDYFLWSSSADSSLADPYLILADSIDYTVDVVPGIAKPVTLPGCRAILS